MRQGLPHRQIVSQISVDLDIHFVTVFMLNIAGPLQVETLLATMRVPVRWIAADKFTVVFEIARLYATDLSSYCLE
ncbi:hypothetical protein SynA1840_00463 [Synechococcus sp. A18-40]|nr:hypothetical protein SynA1840_00463 [Synechococcus sp. A18-40]